MNSTLRRSLLFSTMLLHPFGCKSFGPQPELYIPPFCVPVAAGDSITFITYEGTITTTLKGNPAKVISYYADKTPGLDLTKVERPAGKFQIPHRSALVVEALSTNVVVQEHRFTYVNFLLAQSTGESMYFYQLCDPFLDVAPTIKESLVRELP